MLLNGTSKCRKCGQAIRWITTEKGKPMPVNNKILFLKPDKEGDYQAITTSGKFVRGDKVEDPESPEAVGCFESHFSSCPSAANFRRPPKKKEKANAQQPRLFGYDD